MSTKLSMDIHFQNADLRIRNIEVNEIAWSNGPITVKHDDDDENKNTRRDNFLAQSILHIVTLSHTNAHNMLVWKIQRI